MQRFSRVTLTGWLIIAFGFFPILTGATDALADGSTVDSSTLGTGLGALGGAVLGSQLGKKKNKEQNALIGGVLGGVLGYGLGKQVDGQGTAQPQASAPSQRSGTWVNPDAQGPRRVNFEPARKPDSPPVCKKMEVVTLVNGREKTVVRTACKRDGQWVVQSSEQPATSRYAREAPLPPPVVEEPAGEQDDDEAPPPPVPQRNRYNRDR